MESPASVSRYVARNYNKRVFPDDDVFEVPPPPPIKRAAKSNSSKQKEVICHEIIDLDEEEDYGHVLHIDGDRKGKKPLANSLVMGLGSLAATDGSGSAIQKSKHVDDFNPNVLYEEDWINKFYDDIVYDHDSALESHFDHMDFLPGVEAPFTWWPNNSQTDTKAGDLTSSSSSKIGNQATRQNPKRKLSSKWRETGSSLNRTTNSSSRTAFLSAQISGGSLPSGTVSSSRKSRSRVSSSLQNQYSSGAILASTLNNHSIYPNLSMSSAPGVGMHMPTWPTFPLNMPEPPIGSSAFNPFMNGSGFVPLVQDSADNQSGVTSAKVKQKNADEILQDLVNFKNFDIVKDYSDHHFAKHKSSAEVAPKNWAKRIQSEWKILENDIPDTIFVRVYESRMDILRAVIVGAEGTPYHDGLFFFDVFFPSNYPNVPPHVHYHSGGLRINPNLYQCGKVCLSLLNTWTGSGKEKWIPRESTTLQVLVSIQGLILNAKPYFNEPGYSGLGGTKHGDKEAMEYNERTFMHSLQTMVYSMRRPPKHFEAYVAGHFCKRAREILVSCRAYLDGAQVGCLVKGGVQDVDEGDKSCSKDFRNRLARFITTLVNAFSQIGAKDCQEFLCLSQRATGPAPPTASLYAGFYM